MYALLKKYALHHYNRYAMVKVFRNNKKSTFGKGPNSIVKNNDAEIGILMQSTVSNAM